MATVLHGAATELFITPAFPQCLFPGSPPSQLTSFTDPGFTSELHIN